MLAWFYCICIRSRVRIHGTTKSVSEMQELLYTDTEGLDQTPHTSIECNTHKLNNGKGTALGTRLTYRTVSLSGLIQAARQTG